MNVDRKNWQIIIHFGWTVAIAAAFFEVGSRLFELVLLFNAGFAATMALLRGESLGLRRFTLWDEAVAFLGISALAALWL
jgi:hypothetical protein